ncbi:hypothetical protein ACFQ4K_13270 [Tistrella bauzanensis]
MAASCAPMAHEPDDLPPEGIILPSTDPIIVMTPDGRPVPADPGLDQPILHDPAVWQPVVWPPGSVAPQPPAAVDALLDAGMARRFETMARLKADNRVTAKLAADRRAVNLGGLLPLSYPASVTIDPLMPAPTPAETMARFRALDQMVVDRVMTQGEAQAERARIVDAVLPPAPPQPLPAPQVMTATELADHGRRIDAWLRRGLITVTEASAERSRVIDLTRQIEMQAAMQAAPEPAPPVEPLAPSPSIPPATPALPVHDGPAPPRELPPPQITPATPTPPVLPAGYPGLAPIPARRCPSRAGRSVWCRRQGDRRRPAWVGGGLNEFIHFYRKSGING